MKTIKVNFEGASFPLFIGNDVLERFSELLNLYRFPDKIAIVLQEGVSAQFIPGYETFDEIILPKNINLSELETIEQFYAGIPWKQIESSFTLIVVGDELLLNLVSFACRLLTHPPVIVNMPTTLWAMSECGVKNSAFLNWKKRPSVISVFTWPQMAILDLQCLQNTDRNEIFLLHASFVRNLLLASSEKFAEYEESWQKIGFENEELLIDSLEFNAKTRIAIYNQGNQTHYLLEDFGNRAINIIKSEGKYRLKPREIASMIFLELRWRIKLAEQCNLDNSEESSRVLFLIERLLAEYHVKQEEWDKARDLLLQCFTPTMLNNLYLPSAIGKIQKLKSIDRSVAEQCLVDC